ncbi:MAG: glycosyltransferase [Bacteroidales bacterium]|nr:glycosyltransferase [Bacteroidales bacterium]MBR4688011.1 glycosyltransferase [Bacteroidales bacterium]
MDGVAVCVENYARWIQEKVGGVSVVTPRKLNAHYGQYPYEVLDYASVPVPFRHPYVTGIAQIDPLLRAKLYRRRFKIVHAHSPFSAGLMALQVAKTQHIPLVATFHSKFKDDFREVIPSDMVVDQAIKVVMEFFEHADEVWVPQASVEEVIREYGFKGHVEVVDNGSDLVADYPDAYFEDARKALGIAPEEFVFLFVGQHIWQKNVRLVIDALERIKDLPFRMFFVGTGYAAGEMKELVAQKGLSDKVTFTGMLTEREKVTRYYAAADLFLFPSLYDNAPLVVREAAALHTPAVMVEGSTAAEILRDGENGYLVPNELDAFAARLRQLYRDRAEVRRVGLTASRTIVRSWEDVVGEVLDRYDAIIARKTRIRPLK